MSKFFGGCVLVSMRKCNVNCCVAMSITVKITKYFLWVNRMGGVGTLGALFLACSRYIAVEGVYSGHAIITSSIETTHPTAILRGKLQIEALK